MSSRNTSNDLTDMQWGLGVGCSIAIILNIISWACFLRAVYDYFTYESPPSSKLPAPSLPSPVLPAASPVASVPPPIPRPPIKPDCPMPICQEYFERLNLRLFFTGKIDCFCVRCRPDVRRKTHNHGGHDYTIPYGWVRFRIKTEEVHIQVKQIFRRWATSYYGIWEEKLEQILRNREMPLPGDRLLDRTTFADHSRDQKHCFTSPSINYASNWQRSPKRPFIASNGRSYDLQITLQCRQKPGTFIIQPGTPGLCDIIPANVIEWKTVQRSTIIPNGLMINVVPT